MAITSSAGSAMLRPAISSSMGGATTAGADTGSRTSASTVRPSISDTVGAAGAGGAAATDAGGAAGADGAAAGASTVRPKTSDTVLKPGPAPFEPCPNVVPGRAMIVSRTIAVVATTRLRCGPLCVLMASSLA